MKYVFVGIESFGLVIHKSPIVWSECMRLVSDVEYLDIIFGLFSDVRNTKAWTHLIENVMFNFGDIMENITQGKRSLALKRWNTYGESLGRILNDVFYNSPIDEDSWTPANSHIISEDRTAIKVPSSFYKEYDTLEVESG